MQRSPCHPSRLPPAPTCPLASDKLFYFLFQSIPEICAMGGITLEDLRQSKAYQEIFGLGEAREAAKVALSQLTRRCGPLREATNSSIQALPLEQLEALAEALLDFSGPDDLEAWLYAR